MTEMSRALRRFLAAALALSTLAALPACGDDAHAGSTVVWHRNPVVAYVGDSLGTGNEGFLGAVRLYLPFYNSIVADFAGPLLFGGTTNLGAPSWHVVSTDGFTIQQIRGEMATVAAATPGITDLFFEGGVNDVTDQIDPAVSNAQFVGAMGDAVTLFPHIRNFFYVSIACAGEMYHVVNGVPSFFGNTLLSGGVDAAIDSLLVTLKASVLAQTGTNADGVAINYVYLPMRDAAVAQLFANGCCPAPWQNAFYLTVDGRHPAPNGIDVTLRTVARAAITSSP